MCAYQIFKLSLGIPAKIYRWEKKKKTHLAVRQF